MPLLPKPLISPTVDSQMTLSLSGLRIRRVHPLKLKSVHWDSVSVLLLPSVETYLSGIVESKCVPPPPLAQLCRRRTMLLKDLNNTAGAAGKVKPRKHLQWAIDQMRKQSTFTPPQGMGVTQRKTYETFSSGLKFDISHWWSFRLYFTSCICRRWDVHLFVSIQESYVPHMVEQLKSESTCFFFIYIFFN